MNAPSSAEGNVVSLTQRAAYRPDFRALASAQIRAAREKLRMDHPAFAEYMTGLLGWPVQPGVSSRWEQGTGTPPGDAVLAAAVAAQSGPALDRDPAERVTVWADRGLITRQDWNSIITGSREHLWLYGMAELGYAEDDETPGIMSEVAASGCRVRVLLLSPGYAGIPEIDAAEGSPAGTLKARIHVAMARFARMRQDCGGQMEVRAYDAHPRVSVVRGDDEMLFTPYLRFTTGSNSPTFGITESSAARTFRRYARDFNSMWDLAKEVA